MAKARKQKTEEQKTNNNSNKAVVRHQKICLSIDIEKRLVYGFTELQVEVPDNRIVALHADNLVIEAVTVDGEPARSEVFPHYVPLDNENRWCGVSSVASAADAAGSVYLSTLERELVPNLLIMCPKSDVSASGQPENSENGLNSSEGAKKVIDFNLRSLRVDYWVEKAETGIHFENDVLHTDNQIRRARCWFPCMDDSSQSCCYDLEFTVAENFVAVSSGTLLYQILSQDGLRKTYVYKVNVPVTPRWISLAVAPFEIISDSHIGVLSYICMQGSMEKLQNTVGFFHSAFRYYEEYLSTSFPFGSYTQVFLPPEIAISSMSLGVSMTIFSSQYLFDEKVIDQTIDTRIKLALALARQWFGVYVSCEEPSDDWLLDGLAWFLTDLFIKQFLGNNEARYRRYKANSAVSKADDSGATTLSSPASSVNLYGTQSIGFYGKMRSWKSVAVLQMLEKQMGPESFRKILQNIISRAQDSTRPLRTLNTTEFRHLANKVGNLERPFLKEFFPRWVGSCGCPVLRMGFSYNKRKNLVELAAMRGCTAAASADSITTFANGKNTDSENREGNVGWPGMMSIRVHELDGMYDHPILPMAGEALQLLEMQCHSKLASKRFQKPRKGSKPDGSDENGDVVSAIDVRSNSDSALLWLRADPEMEFLAEINFNQPVQMWLNQLERDKDVVAQSQAISMIETLPQLSFSVVNALSNFIGDAKAFWRVRIEAAYALAITASEETDWAGLLHLIKFYKSRRFDANIGLPKPNDFHDFPEYFLLEAIPNAVAMVRASDKKSPREAVEFVLHLLKYNDNNGNPYSDVYWLGSLVQSIGELEFGQQSLPFLSSLLKRIDRILQFDRLMPSYNGILTISCIRSLTQVALKLYKFIPLDRVSELIKPFRDLKIMWQVRIEASKALLDLEFHCKGFDGVLALFMSFIEEEPTLRGQVKMGVHVTRLCQMRSGSHSVDDIKSDTLKSLLCLLESSLAFNNVVLRHYLFCVLQVLAGRPPTLYGIPRSETTQMGHAEMINFFAALMNQPKDFDSMVHDPNSSDMGFTEDFPYTSMVDPIADISNISTQEKAIAGIVDLTLDPTQNVPGFLHKDPDADLTNNVSLKEPMSPANLATDQPAPITHLSNDLSQKEPAPSADLFDDLSQKEPAPIADLSGDLSQKEPAPIADLSGDLSQKEPAPIADLSGDLSQKEPAHIANLSLKEPAHVADLSGDLSLNEPAPVADLSGDHVLKEPVPVVPVADLSGDHVLKEPVPVVPGGVLSVKEPAPVADLSGDLLKEPAPIADLSGDLLRKEPVSTANLSDDLQQNEPLPAATKEPSPAANLSDDLSQEEPARTAGLPNKLSLEESAPTAGLPNNVSQEEPTPTVRDAIPNNHEKRRVLKIKVRPYAASSRAEDADDNPGVERLRGGLNNVGPVASSSVSVDVPVKIFTEAMSVSNQNIEEVNSCHDPGSRMTASIGSAKLAEELGKELQCTADSSNILKDNGGVKTQKYASLQTLSVPEKEKKKGKEKKRKRDKDKSHRDDPEYREKKRLKKEKKQKEKKMAKLLNIAEVKVETGLPKGNDEVKKDEIGTRLKLVSKDAKQEPIESTSVKEQEPVRRGNIDLKQRVSGGPKVIIKMADNRPDPSEANSSHKFRIKIKKRAPNQE